MTFQRSHFCEFVSQKRNYFNGRKKVYIGHGLNARLQAYPDLLRRVRLRLWLRNHFPGLILSLNCLQPFRLLPDGGLVQDQTV